MSNTISSTFDGALRHQPNLADEIFGPSRQFRPCPRCGESLRRVRRRPIDRFMSQFYRVYRYRCFANNCSWEGNLSPPRVIDTRIEI